MIFEIFQFTLGSEVYNLTSSSTPQVWNNLVYTPASISRSEVKHTSDLSGFDINVHIEKASQVVPLALFRPSDNTLDLRISRIQDGVQIGLWAGRVTNASIITPVEVELQCRPIIEIMDRSGLSPTYARECRHALYGDECGVLRENFRVTASITEIEGTFIRVPDILNYDATWFSLGYVAWGQNQRGVRRSLSDAWLELTEPFINLSTPQQVNLYPGCSRTMTVCKNKFDNTINYGGFPWVPRKNPFDTTLY